MRLKRNKYQIERDQIRQAYADDIACLESQIDCVTQSMYEALGRVSEREKSAKSRKDKILKSRKVKRGTR